LESGWNWEISAKPEISGIQKRQTAGKEMGIRYGRTKVVRSGAYEEAGGKGAFGKTRSECKAIPYPLSNSPNREALQPQTYTEYRIRIIFKYLLIITDH